MVIRISLSAAAKAEFRSPGAKRESKCKLHMQELVIILFVAPLLACTGR